MCQYAVVDLEMCRVPKKMRSEKFHWAQETIQIAAVLLNESYEIIDRFSSYVAPEFGTIDPYIERLTRISDMDVKSAPHMKEALKKFIDWLPHDTRFVAWSNSDRAQIQHEIIAKSIVFDGVERLENTWIDCQKLFGTKLAATHSYNLTEALNLSDIPYRDGTHDGLVDAYNTALLFIKLSRTPEYRLNQHYITEVEGLSVSMEGLFAKLNLAFV